MVEANSAPAAGARIEMAIQLLTPASLVVAAPAGRALDAAAARPIVELAQEKGIAALIQSEPELARSLEADGVHLPWRKDVISAYAAAREILGPGRIVGADAGRSRHDAMTLGEQGADYVAFGIPAHVGDRETARARRRELVAWWAEIFEVPVVGFDLESPEEAAELAAAGADFVAVTLADAMPAGEIESWVKAVEAATPGLATVA